MVGERVARLEGLGGVDRCCWDARGPPLSAHRRRPTRLNLLPPPPLLPPPRHLKRNDRRPHLNDHPPANRPSLLAILLSSDPRKSNSTLFPRPRTFGPPPPLPTSTPSPHLHLPPPPLQRPRLLEFDRSQPPTSRSSARPTRITAAPTQPALSLPPRPTTRLPHPHVLPNPTRTVPPAPAQQLRRAPRIRPTPPRRDLSRQEDPSSTRSLSDSRRISVASSLGGTERGRDRCSLPSLLRAR